MNETFVLKIKNHVESNLRDINEDMNRVCLAIIDHVAVGPSKKSHLTFTELYRISPKVNEDDFYEAVFYLTKKNVNVLKQQFEAFDPNSGFKSVPDREQIFEDMRNEDFYNPFTGQKLTEQQFGEQVPTYFSPSEYFMEMIDA